MFCNVESWMKEVSAMEERAVMVEREQATEEYIGEEEFGQRAWVHTMGIGPVLMGKAHLFFKISLILI